MSDSAAHRRASALFLAAIDLEPAERGAFLDRECGGDARLRSDVESLLASDSGAERFLGEPALGAGAASPAASFLDEARDGGSGSSATSGEPASAEERIGPFRILSKLGQGGMGVVYAAEQLQPHRRIALKVLRGALSTSEERRRFDYESGVLARLRHPCIAQVYEVGSLEAPGGESTPYFAMELVDGARPITEYATHAGLSLEARLDLFARVLDGVHHGHQRGVVHRDLKPANILVDAEGSPKIIDFGVARVMRSDESLGTVHTMAGQLIGTLEYMSPEHVSGDPEDVDSRADVYSMGVVLYELVSGKLPYDVHDAGVLDAIQKIRDTRPRRLSTLNARFRGDLDTIVDKALSKERDRRYASASELAADIRRFLKHEPIAARPASAFYQLRLLARRNRPAVAAAGIVFAALVAGIVVSTRFAWIADERAERSRRDAYRANLLAAGLAIDAGQLLDGKSYLDRADSEMRGWEWRHLLARTAIERRVFGPFDGVADCIATRPGRSEVAVVTRGAGVLVLDAASGDVRRIDLGELAAPKEAFYDAEGRFLRVAGHNDPNGWWLATLEADGGRRVSALRFPGFRRRMLAVHEASRRMACVSDEQGVEIRSLDDGSLRVRRPLRPGINSYSRPAFAPDGRTLVVSSADNAILLLDGSTLETVRTLGPVAPLALDFAFDASGRWLAAGGEDGAIGLWDLSSTATERARRLTGHGGSVLGMAFHPREPLLVSASNDSTLRVYDVETGVCLSELRGHADWVTDVAFFRDGTAVASSSADGTARVFDVALLEDTSVLRGHASYVNPVVVSPDGRMVVSGGWDGFAGSEGAIRYWDADTGQPIGAWKGRANVVSLAYSPEGDRIAAGSSGTVFMIDPETGETRDVISDLAGYVTASFSPDGETLAVGDAREVALFHSRTFERIAGHPRSMTSMAPPLFSRDGSWLCAARDNTSFMVLDARTLAPVDGLGGPGVVGALASDGRRALSVHDDGVRVHDTRDFKTIAEIRAKRVMHAVFSPGDDRLFIGSLDGSIQVHDGRTYDEVARFRAHTAYVFSFAFDVGGERLFTGSGDGTIRLWETRPTAARVAARRERHEILGAVAPRVRALFEDEGLSAKEVVARLRGAPFASERERSIALQAALGEALRRTEAPEAR